MNRVRYHIMNADWSSLVVVLSALFVLAAAAVAGSRHELPGAGPALNAALDAGWQPKAVTR